ncbi:MAG: HU family DNA-binding protein [Alloprevotella sp.]|nr:HU family DNA-binding protein [Alloprevotella sp.]
MNKTELVAAIAAKAELTKVDAKKALEAALAAVKESLAKDENVALVGFGTLKVVKRAARQGVNPAQPTKKIKIPAKKVVKFKAGAELEAAVK